jgi:quercetin dioxygenase-like cupin family protein/DNA-binding XRE family transcriptional regulator
MSRADAELVEALAAVGPSLKDLRARREMTLASLSEATGISVSTLSRLEAGARRASLELLVPIARTYEITLDDLVNVPRVTDPRVRGKPITRGNLTMLPLTRHGGDLMAFKVVVQPTADPPNPQGHDGYEWLYVLAGRLRLVLGTHDLVMKPGEAAEFDTRVPHWFGAANGRVAEFVSLFGPQGERLHLRARPTGTSR